MLSTRITEDFGHPQGRFPNSYAYDPVTRVQIEKQTHIDVRNFRSDVWSEGAMGEQADLRNWPGLSWTLIVGENITESLGATVDLATGFEDSDGITVTLPGLPTGSLDMDDSFIEFTSHADGDFDEGPTDSIPFTGYASGELTFLRSQLVDVDLEAITGVRFRVTATAGTTMRILGIRLFGADWEYGRYDIDTRDQLLVLTVAPNGNPNEPYDFTFPALYRAKDPSDLTDPQPIDVSLSVVFNTGSKDGANSFTTYFREAVEDYITMIDLTNVPLSQLAGKPLPATNTATDATDPESGGVDVLTRYDPRNISELDTMTIADLEDDTIFDIERVPDALLSAFISVSLAWDGVEVGTNFVTNPMPVGGYTGYATTQAYWLNPGAVLSGPFPQSGSPTYQGTNYGRVTMANTGVQNTGVAFTVPAPVGGWVAGQSYTFSLDVFPEAGATTIGAFAGLAGANSANATWTLAAGWNRRTLTWVPSVSSSANAYVGLRNNNAVGVSSTVAFGRLLFREGTATSYFDGSTQGYEWSGTANASTSIPEEGTTTLSILDSEGNGGSFDDIDSLDPNSRYVLFIDLFENTIRARLHEIDNNNQVLGLVYDTTEYTDDFTIKRRKGRVGYAINLEDGDAWVSEFRTRGLVFAEYRSRPLKSITPVVGAELYAEVTPDTEHFTGLDSGPNGGVVVLDKSRSNSEESYKIINSGVDPDQGVWSNEIEIDSWDNYRISFDVWYPAAAITADNLLEVHMVSVETGHEFNLSIGQVKPDQWHHVELVPVEGNTALTGRYRIFFVQPAEGQATTWWLDNISVVQAATRWEARSTAVDPWGDNDAPWMTFGKLVNGERDGIRFRERGTELQVRGLALSQDVHLGKVHIVPKYAELGRPIWPEDDVVVNVAPVADFDTTAEGSNVIAFDGSPSTDGDNSIIAYVWDFGDGARGYGRNVRHTYAEAGLEYNVTLTVIDAVGASHSFSDGVGV